MNESTDNYRRAPRPQGSVELPPGARADLHTHSLFSDGTLAPGDLITAALQSGLHALSLTDHDTVAGIDEARRASEGKGLVFITGVELSVGYGPGEIHILGYGVDARDRAFSETLELLASERLERMVKMVRKLQGLGIPADFEEVRKMAGGVILSRLHLANYLLEHKHVSSRDEAFARYIGNGRPAYVRRRHLSLKDAMGLIIGAGGLPVLAHPGLTRRDDLIEYLVRIGLRGLEVYYPRHTRGDVARYLKICEKYHLLATGGSDFHGAGKPEVALGDSLMPREQLSRMLSSLKG